jgi:hypothetical protein
MADWRRRQRPPRGVVTSYPCDCGLDCVVVEGSDAGADEVLAQLGRQARHSAVPGKCDSFQLGVLIFHEAQ